MAWQPDRDHLIHATELAAAALEPTAAPEPELRSEGWTLVARTLWPQTAAVLLLRRASPSLTGFFGAGFVRHPSGWDVRVEHADEWPGEELVRSGDGGAWSLHGTWAANVYLFVGQAATQVASVRMTIGPHTQALRPQSGSGAFAVAGLVPTGKLVLEAVDADGRVLDRHETRHV